MNIYPKAPDAAGIAAYASDCRWCERPHPAPPEHCKHGLLLMGCDGCWLEAHPFSDAFGRAIKPAGNR